MRPVGKDLSNLTKDLAKAAGMYFDKDSYGEYVSFPDPEWRPSTNVLDHYTVLVLLEAIDWIDKNVGHVSPEAKAALVCKHFQVGINPPPFSPEDRS